MAHSPDVRQLAERLHSVAVRLIRRLRKSDGQTGLSAPKLSALSVLVFGGPASVTALAAAEQVRAPTMSRLVAQLEEMGLATKVRDADDTRVVRVQATRKGRALMEAGRAMRLEPLAADLADLGIRERNVLQEAADILARLNEVK